MFERSQKSKNLAVNNRLTAALYAVVLLAVAALLPGFATANEYKQAATQSYLVQPTPAVTLETATAIVRHKTGGRVLSANPASKGTEVGYQVRVLVDERLVQTWFVDEQGRTISE